MYRSNILNKLLDARNRFVSFSALISGTVGVKIEEERVYSRNENQRIRYISPLNLTPLVFNSEIGI